MHFFFSSKFSVGSSTSSCKYSIVKFIVLSPQIWGILIIHLKMVIIGWNNLELANNIENDEGRNKVAQTIPVDRRSDESVQNSNFDQVVSQWNLAPWWCQALVLNITDYRLQISDFRFQISDYRLQISDFRFQITDYRFHISYFIFQITDYRLQITDYRFQITDYRLQITDYRLQITDYRFLISDFWFQISDFRFQIRD